MPYAFGHGYLGMALSGFPHSETPGSKAVCASPGLIAAGRVLRRLPVPRHPPCALGILTPHRGRSLRPIRSYGLGMSYHRRRSFLGSSDEFVSVVGYVSIVAIDRIRDERITAELLSEDNIVNMR